MKFFVKMAVFETHADDKAIRNAVGGQIQKIMTSGKLESAGAFGDIRGAYMVVNAASAAELQELIGLPILTNMHVECHPLMSIEELGAFFKKHENE